MGGLNPLDQIQPWVILSVIGIFCITLFVLRRVFFLPYIEVMELRESERVAADREIAEANGVVGDARAEAERIRSQARERAEEMARASGAEDEAYRRRVLETAMHESSATLERGRVRIASERDAEVERLREEAVECVTLACDRLLGAADPAAVSGAVDKLLARRLQ
jgi:F0F1-type ATP synthase membrane subunit b/b'